MIITIQHNKQQLNKAAKIRKSLLNDVFNNITNKNIGKSVQYQAMPNIGKPMNLTILK